MMDRSMGASIAISSSMAGQCDCGAGRRRIIIGGNFKQSMGGSAQRGRLEADAPSIFI